MDNLQPMNWQRERLIGSGTLGNVYVGRNRDNGTILAVRDIELSSNDPDSAVSARQLEQQVHVLSQLNHPNVVKYYGSEMVAHHLYIFMEYVHSGSINTFSEEPSGAMTELYVRNFTHHILSGLAYLHSNNTVHRNIRGENLLVDGAGVVKLSDFGIDKHLTGLVTDLRPMNRNNAYWMAPEVIERFDDDNPYAADIWSLGCTIIEMFTGKPPWSEYESIATLFKILESTPPIPETLSLDGKDFLRCCFERNPENRSSAAMLLEHPFVKNFTGVVVSGG